MSEFWIGVLVAAAIWVVLSFRKRMKAASAHYGLGEATPWLRTRGISATEAKFSSYSDRGLVLRPGSTALVGVAPDENGDLCGFAVEVAPGQGVVAGVLLIPFGIATHHRRAALNARAAGVSLVEYFSDIADSEHDLARHKSLPDSERPLGASLMDTGGKRTISVPEGGAPQSEQTSWTEYERPAAQRRR